MKSMVRRTGTAKQRRVRHARVRAGEGRLIALALVVIAVAAASIGALLALQYRAAAPVPVRSLPVTANAPEPPLAAPERRALPQYEEPIEPAALPPLPAPPRPSSAAVTSARPSPPVAPSHLQPALRRHAVMVFLPYAQDLPQQTADARKAGHELLVHVPMDPRNRAITDPGPNALLVDLAADELRRRIDWNLSQFDGYVGINNHMGSRFTADADALTAVMSELRRRGLLFLDSRTSAGSAGLATAQHAGVPALARDVFLDHAPAIEAVRLALAEVEQIARRNGHAVAIGHPRDATIEALAEWLPQLSQRGFRLVPLSALVRENSPSG